MPRPDQKFSAFVEFERRGWRRRRAGASSTVLLLWSPRRGHSGGGVAMESVRPGVLAKCVVRRESRRLCPRCRLRGRKFLARAALLTDVDGRGVRARPRDTDERGQAQKNDAARSRRCARAEGHTQVSPEVLRRLKKAHGRESISRGACEQARSARAFVFCYYNGVQTLHARPPDLAPRSFVRRGRNGSGACSIPEERRNHVRDF